MVSKVFIVHLTFLLFLSVHCFGREGALDSLKNQLSAANQPKEKIEILNEIARLCLKEYDSAGFTYANEALQIAQKNKLKLLEGHSRLYLAKLYYRLNYDSSAAEKNFKIVENIYRTEADEKDFAQYYLNYGLFKSQIHQYPAALINFNKGLEIVMELGDSLAMANFYFNIGITYHELGNYSRALEHYFIALEIDEKINHTDNISRIYNSIAISYSVQENAKKAIEYYKKAIVLEEKKGDDISKAICLLNLGILYKNENLLDSAFKVYEDAATIFSQQKMSTGLLYLHNNFGEALLKANRYEEATENFQMAISLAEEQNNTRIRTVALTGLSEAYLQQNKLQQSLGAANDAFKNANDLKLMEIISKAGFALYKVHKRLNQLDEALTYHEQYVLYKDSVYSMEKEQKINELHTRYETEKKEQEILLLNKDKALKTSELKSKEVLQNALIGGFVSILLVIGLGYRGYKIKQDNNRKLISEQLHLEKIEAGRLTVLNKMKSHFFSNIAHEFRTPLTLIIGPAEQIAEKPELPNIQKNIPIIKRSANKLLNLINQLLDLSKLEEGELTLHRKNMNLIAFLKGITLSFESLAMEKDIELLFKSDIDNVLMGIDVDRTDKIFFNLLSNAFKFTPVGGKIEVVVQLTNSDNQPIPEVEISVKDSGPGISQEHLPYLFDRFFQIEGAFQPSGGTGIGLALSKEMVELHEGTLTVESEVGVGSIFKVTLPVLQQENSENSTVDIDYSYSSLQVAKVAEFNDTNLQHEGDLDKPLLLIVEDNPEVRSFIKDCVESEYQILEARNGVEGLELATKNIPDLIITDVMMPEMDGYQLCSLLKKDSLTNHIPLIMLTAKAGMDSKLEGLQLGADDYLGKPFHRKELLIRIKNLIATRNLLKQKYLQNIEEDQLLPEFVKEEDVFLINIRAQLDAQMDQEDFGIDELCKAVGTSRTQLHRKLKALSDLSTSRFIRLHKLQKAIDLLKNENYNISEVSYMTGFSSPSYFTQCFQEELNYAPSELLKNKG